MMDIVKRLRKQKWQVLDEMRGLIEDTTAYEAADEIERLREALRQIQGLGDTADDSWKTYQICCEALGEKND